MEVQYSFQPGACHAQWWQVTAYLQSCLWAEAVTTAVILENNLITPTRTLSPFQQFFGKGKKSVLSVMQKLSEMCIITFKDNTHWAKLANQGTPSIWVGYAENHQRK